MSEREFRRGVIADDGVHWRLASMKKIRPQAWIVTSSSFHENTHVITQPLFPSLHTQTVCSCYSNHVVHSETDRRCLGDWLQPIPDSAIFFDWDVVQPKVTVLERFAFPSVSSPQYDWFYLFRLSCFPAFWATVLFAKACSKSNRNRTSCLFIWFSSRLLKTKGKIADALLWQRCGASSTQWGIHFQFRLYVRMF